MLVNVAPHTLPALVSCSISGSTAPTASSRSPFVGHQHVVVAARRNARPLTRRVHDRAVEEAHRGRDTLCVGGRSERGVRERSDPALGTLYASHPGAWRARENAVLVLLRILAHIPHGAVLRLSLEEDFGFLQRSVLDVAVEDDQRSHAVDDLGEVRNCCLDAMRMAKAVT